MKILYGIQCTGNGHITRSVNLVSKLREYVQVDVLTSGSHSELNLPFSAKYSKKGLAYFFGKNGSFDLKRTLKENNPVRFMKEVAELPTQLYDMVITDFEPISAWSAKKNWVYSVSVSNQASLLNPDIKKPKVRNPLSELLINHFCPTTKKYGLFYEKLNSDLYYPPIRDGVKRLNPFNGGHYLVYLPFYGNEIIVKHLSNFKDQRWIVFSKHTSEITKYENVEIRPINDEDFLSALESCSGVMSSAGFGTTSEAIYLRKKLIIMPMKNQYEQQCNAHVLSQHGIPILNALKKKYYPTITDWINSNRLTDLEIIDESDKLARTILEDYIRYKSNPEILTR